MEAAQVLRAVDAAQTTAADEHANVVRPLKRMININIEESAPEPPAGKPVNAAQILAHGIADMRDAAPTKHRPTDDDGAGNRVSGLWFQSRDCLPA